MEDNTENIELKSTNARRNLTLKNNVARQIAVNFMPSRQIAHNTLRLRRVNSEQNALLDDIVEAPDGADRQADIIVRELEQHRRLMEDNPVSEELRREALRDLPQGLTMKRSVRAKLSASVSLRSKQRPISMWKRLKYRLGFAWKRGRDRFSSILFSMELWYEAIRTVEGHLGSAVGSYFHLLKWLFSVNLLLTILVVCFVVVPQVLYDNTHAASGPISFVDVVSGMGGLEQSLVFYGHYHAGDVSTGPLRYNMPFAYFFSMLCLYLAVFAVLCHRTAYLYRRNFIETSGGLPHVFAGKVFCGWDHSIVSQHAASLNAASLYNEFKELLSEQNKSRTRVSFGVTCGRRLANAVVWALVVALVAGLQCGLWQLLGVRSATAHWPVVVSLVVTATLALTPLLLNLVVRMEFYDARASFYVTLARTWLLDVSTFTMMFVYWSRSAAECWETSFAQEMYRLVLLDALVSLLLLPAVELVRGLIYKSSGEKTRPEFNMAYNSLTLIYNQSLLWFGLLFSPLLVVIVTAKFLLLFYVKKEIVLRMCHPARKVWRAAQSQTLLMVLVTLSLFATLFVVGTIFLNSSSQCGPFSLYEPVWQLVEQALGLSRHTALRRLLQFVVRPGAVAFLLLALCVTVYFVRAKSLAQRSMVTLLRQMLVLQAQDKDFLLSAIDKVSNGEWLYSPRPEQGADSHTWRYLQDVRKPSNAGYHLDASRRSRAASERAPDRGSGAPDDGDTDSSFSWQGSSRALNAADNRWL